MVRMFLLVAAVGGMATPAVAQFGPPVVVVARPGFWGWFWVPPPPIIVVRPVPLIPRDAPRFEWPREPEPQRDPAEDRAAEERVKGAVARGELMVVTPGKAIARSPDLPKIQPPAAPPVALPPDPKPPAEPKALAAFRIASGRAAFAGGQYGRAAEQFRLATTARPNDAEAYFLLAQARTARREYAEAVDAIRQGMAREPNWPAARFLLADLYGDRREPLAAHLTDLREAADAPAAPPATRFLYAYHLWFAGEKAAAVKVFRALSAAVKDNAEIERFLQEAEGKKL